MEDRFFVPSFGNRPRYMVGREDVLNDFSRCLDSPPGSREKVLLLLGQRGTGKTVLLLELAEMARNKGIVVASPTIPGKDMQDRILEKLRISGEDIIGKQKPKVSGGNISVPGFGAGIQIPEENSPKKSFAQQLSELCELCNEKNRSVLILIDEVQANNEELRQLIVAYQELVGEGREISMVLAGLPMVISSVLNDHVLTFLNRAVKVDLPLLNKNDIFSYYTNAFRELGIQISSEKIKEAAACAKGSPYLMQLIGHYITLLSDKTGVLRDEDYLQALSSAEEVFKNDICRTTLDPLSDRDIDFLTAMAKIDDESDISLIAEALGTTDAYAQTYKRRLIQAGVIYQPRRGKVSFAVPYLKEYLSHTGEEQ